MDWNKLKLTKLDDEIISFLFRNPTTIFMGKEIASRLKVSQTAVSKSIKRLSKIGLVINEKKIILSISLNREDRDTFDLKRVYNLKSLYSSGLVKKLSDDFPGATAILFGSYSYGEDTEESDIDLAIIGYNEGKIDYEKFENLLQRKIQIQFFESFKNMDKNLKANVFDGITLYGAVSL